MKSITVHELKHWRDNNTPHKLIDVREPFEIEIATMGADSVPLGEIVTQHDAFDSDVPVVVHCRSGKRSGNAIALLAERFGYDNLYNLEGGILAWATEIDQSIAIY